jgi:anaerobic selenocysteine-containing dehydrogenase
LSGSRDYRDAIRAAPLGELSHRLSAARAEVEARGETFYPGPSRVHLAAFPPRERWDDWIELDSKAWPDRVEKRYALVPTTCFNCESACGLLAYVDKETLQVRKFEGNPEHPGSRGRNCAKGPATLNQLTDPDRILHPLQRAGRRGEGRWVEVSWDEALNDIAARVRSAIREDRRHEVMYHVGRPGEDGFTERVLAAWGIDGHNSHTNICSSGARAGYHFWMGFDRPSPDHANARVILLISSHLEAGHYFNPHAQRIIEGKENGAKLIVFDTRLSNTATHADHWIAPFPGSEAAILLAIARELIRTRRYNRDFVRRWWNWEQYLAAEHPDAPSTFDEFERILEETYAAYTFDFAARESGVDAGVLKQIAELVAGAGTRLSTHNWRSAASGNLGGWQVSRCLFMLNALTGAIATEGGTFPNAWNKFVPRPIHVPPHPDHWNELSWPDAYPLAMFEMSFLLPHLLRDRRAHIDVYFTRVYNPIWTNPDGFSWIDALTDDSRIGLHVALTPTWSETAFFADYVLPMGLSAERHDVHSYEQYDGQWVGFRQPVLRAARQRLGEKISDTRRVNPGDVWEENEFWIELSWRIDPDGSLGIRRYFESREHPGEKLTVDEYYGWMFAHSVPGLPERAAAEGLTPLDYMRRYGAFEVKRGVGALNEEEVPASELDDVARGDFGRVYTRAPAPVSPNVVPWPVPEPDPDGRRAVGVYVDGRVLRGFPTPSGKLEFYSPTLVEWGWPEYAIPTYIRSQIHPENLAPGEMPLISTFRLPVHIHTRSGNAKWLNEIAHSNPLWMHPTDARLAHVETGDLVRVETAIGHFVVRTWVTEGIRPGVVACSHHMGRWRPEAGGEWQSDIGEPHEEAGQRQSMASVQLEHEGERWGLRHNTGVAAFASDDADTQRIWWTDVGVHQNLTFPVQPDPISGMHCWHQAVRVKRAKAGDQYGDIYVDSVKAREVYQRWLTRTRPASEHSPDGTRRPYWLMRPLRPTREAYRLQRTIGAGSPPPAEAVEAVAPETPLEATAGAAVAEVDATAQTAPPPDTAAAPPAEAAEVGAPEEPVEPEAAMAGTEAAAAEEPGAEDVVWPVDWPTDEIPEAVPAVSGSEDGEAPAEWPAEWPADDDLEAESGRSAARPTAQEESWPIEWPADDDAGGTGADSADSAAKAPPAGGTALDATAAAEKPEPATGPAAVETPEPAAQASRAAEPEPAAKPAKKRSKRRHRR